MSRARSWALRGGLVLVAACGMLRLSAACTEGTSASPVGGGSVNPPLVADPDATPPKPCVEIPMPDGGPVHVRGFITEAVPVDAAPESGKPIANAMVAVEYGGLYLEWCDLSKASPYYVFGAVSDDAGRFEIDVKEGSLGFHAFADDYFYTRAALDSRKATTVAMTMEPLRKTQPQPTSLDAGFDKSTVKSGEMVTYSATLSQEDSGAPLSDENILVEPTRSWCLELHPPKLGKKDDFADGLWKRTFPAPDKPGTYTYWFSATTAQCVTSKLVTSTLKVE